MYIQPENMTETNILQYNYQIRGFYFRRHIHRFPEIVYVYRGRLEFTLGNKSYTAEEGDFVFFHPLQIHGFDTLSGCDCIVSAFPDSLLGGVVIASDKVGATPIFRYTESVQRFFEATFVKGELDGIGLRDAGRMPNDLDRHFVDCGDPSVRCRAQACLSAVFGEYLRAVPQVDYPRDEHVISKLMFYLNDHFGEELTLSSAAAAIGYSANYLSHCISKTCSMNFATLLAVLRVEHARKLMLSTDMTNLMIAIECGFGSERSFQRMFKRIHGCTPAEYRHGQADPLLYKKV